MSRRLPLLLTPTLVAALAWWFVSASSPGDEARAQAAFPSGIKTVFVIVMENHNWSSIIGNITTAPYINSLLTRSDSSYANQYFNPPLIHPSEPNYIWMEAG